MGCHKSGRTLSQHEVMLRDITTDLITDERIVATEARAKEICSAVEKMIALSRRGDLHTRRQATTSVRNEATGVREEDESIVVESALQKLFNDLGPRFVERQGGYTCILRTKPRRSDTAPTIVIEFVK